MSEISDHDQLKDSARHAYDEGANCALYMLMNELHLSSQDIRQGKDTLDKKVKKLAQRIVGSLCNSELDPQPLTIEEFQAECAEAHYSEKERWLWCVMGTEAGWKKVSALSKWGNFSQYGKAWVTYRHQPKEAAK